MKIKREHIQWSVLALYLLAIILIVSFSRQIVGHFIKVEKYDNAQFKDKPLPPFDVIDGEELCAGEPLENKALYAPPVPLC